MILPLTFRLRDADALASAVLDRLDLSLPSFVSDWLDHEDVHGRATFTAQRSALSIDGVDLRGDNYRLRGRLRLSAGATQARLLVESGMLSVGVGVSRGETDMVVFGASRWFEEESATRPRGVARRAGTRPAAASRPARRR